MVLLSGHAVAAVWVNGVPDECFLLILATHAFQEAVSSVKGN